MSSSVIENHKVNFDQINSIIDKSIVQLNNIGIYPNAGTSIMQVFTRARKLAENSDEKPIGIDNITAGLGVIRLRDAIEIGTSHPELMEPLKRLCKSPINLIDRELSKAKDALFELELAIGLVKQGASYSPGEPDLVLTIAGAKYGIACKKVYSEKRIHDRLRHGVHQIELSKFPGIVAFNLDDLIPAESYLTTNTHDECLRFLENTIYKVINGNIKDLARPLASGRCDGILFSLTAPSDAKHGNPRFSNSSMKILWNLRSAKPQSQKRFMALSEILNTKKIYST